MIKLASPNDDGSSRDDNWQAVDRNRLQTNVIVTHYLAVRNKYEFTGRNVDVSPETDAHDANREDTGKPPRETVNVWRESIDGLFAIVFMAIVFCFCAWMLCHLTIDFASLGDFEIWNYLRQEVY